MGRVETSEIVVALLGFIGSVNAVTAFEAPLADLQTNLIRAAEGGSFQAQSALAGLYWYNAHPAGHRKASDAVEFQKCAYWALKAAGQGEASAQVLIGDLHLDGLGVAQDAFKAYTWYYLAASNRNNIAFLRMAEFYRRQSTESTNRIERYAWLLLATNNISHQLERRENLRCWGLALTPPELEAATDRAKDLFQSFAFRK